MQNFGINIEESSCKLRKTVFNPLVGVMEKAHVTHKLVQALDCESPRKVQHSGESELRKALLCLSGFTQFSQLYHRSRAYFAIPFLHHRARENAVHILLLIEISLIIMADDAGTLPPPAGKWKIPISVFFNDARCVFKRDELGVEILQIALPAALALAADPIASLIDTAFIGHLGPVEIAAVGVSIAIFNQASKVTIFPLVSITTSFVAEEDTVNRINAEQQKGDDLEKGSTKKIESKPAMVHENDATNESLEKGTSTMKDDAKDEDQELKTTICKPLDAPSSSPDHIPHISRETVLKSHGVKSGSPMLSPAQKYLTIRSLGAPAVLLSLAMQGVFRGFKDTKTPLYATVALILYLLTDSCRRLNQYYLGPDFHIRLSIGVSGAAIAHVYHSFLLLARVVAATICVTLAASMAARLGPTPMAAFQVCLQVWMTSSLLADGLAVAGQAILACAFAEKDYQKATAAAARVLQMGFVLGLGLALLVGLGLQFGSGIFTKDKHVIHVIAIGIPFVAATQPINSLAFVFDGVNFGASDFAYSAYSMVLVSVASIGSLFVLSKTNGFVGIWLALTIYMGLRTFAGFWGWAQERDRGNFLRIERCHQTYDRRVEFS
ncbi:protein DETOXIFICATION 43 [Sesamum angolense]|uniref:Protein DETOXIFICATION n=1 Tax=Sesamum angolense TaxID=2727404 RepID=A0AAE1XG03_9LAMI|nr:protein DETOXIFICATION 43 [Sesamum angolense]